jgi:hypothetical protein
MVVLYQKLISKRAEINAIKMAYVRLQNFEKSKYYRDREKEIDARLDKLKFLSN